jgi:hypothetical protein
MTLDADRRVVNELVDRLLALPTFEHRTAFLEDEGLLNPAGLDRLFDVADRLMNNDPGKARRLAELCAELWEGAGAPAAVPRADYIRAGRAELRSRNSRGGRPDEGPWHKPL